MRNIVVIISFIVFSFPAISQTKRDIEKITKDYTIQKLQKKALQFKKEEQAHKAKAFKKAKKSNRPTLIQLPNGNIEELMYFTTDGTPIYYATENLNAALSTRTNHLNSGGSLNLNLNGQDMVARVWDGGTVRRTHHLFEGRVTTIDDFSGTFYSSHATHVTGTILASNASKSTKGMAYEATARTFDWNFDETEALNEALDGMLLSNHSYGIPITSSSGTSLPASFIGSYNFEAKNWDEIAFFAPYYLPVMSAGNSGNDNANTDPIEFGFDKLTGNKTSKNSLIVANAQDAVVDTNGTLISVAINSSSSQGPTDDRRIKPDITGNGTTLLSSTAESDTATEVYSGTSMSSPNVMGTLLLLQQHHKNLTNSFMKAATLKGLACHTADDAGSAGPDVLFGWGLLNAKKAAETITNNGLNTWISEENLNQNQSYTKTIFASGTEPLMASITWTDVPGQVNNSGIINDPTPALVNNLDIKITKDGSIIHYPWRLSALPSNLATRFDDNNVDTIEIVTIDNPEADAYTITVNHKGTLVDQNQNFSLVITGVASQFALVSTSDDLTVCSNKNAVYTFDYKQTGNTTTTFSAENLPAGAVATFSPASLSSNSVVTMTISGLSNVIPNSYTIGIKGYNGIESETRFKKLTLFSDSFTPITLVNPANLQQNLATAIFLKWENSPNAKYYIVQVSTTPNFNDLLKNVVVDTASYLLQDLNELTTYYWRVLPSNDCGTAIESSATVFSFQTGQLLCGQDFLATNFSNATIANTANSTASVPIEVTGKIIIGDLNVILDISHTYIEDLTLTLTGPESIGSPVILLFSEPCGSFENINCNIDDSGGDFVCSTTPPGISGTVKPIDPLSSLNGLPASGTWTLTVNDAYNEDGGTINAVKLSFCSLQAPLSNDDFALSKVDVFPNPAQNEIIIQLNTIFEGETNYNLFDFQGRSIVAKKSNNTTENIDIKQLSEGIYLLNISNKFNQTTKKVIVKR